MTRPSLQVRLLAAYPPYFRRRYEEELRALVDDFGGSRLALTWDLVKGISRAWTRPEFGGTRPERRNLRLRATVSTVFVAFCVAFLSVAAFARSVDDAPVPGLRGWGMTTFHASMVTTEAVAVLIGVVGAVFWLRVLSEAWRTRQRRLGYLAASPALVVAAWLGASWLMGVMARHTVGHQTSFTRLGWWPGVGVLSALVVYVLATLVAAAVCIVSALRAFDLSYQQVGGLRLGTVLAGIVSVGLTVVCVFAALCLVAVSTYGGIGIRDTVTASGAVAMLVVASLVGVVSSVRGAVALPR